MSLDRQREIAVNTSVFDPTEQYGPQNVPTIREQAGFFRYALMESHLRTEEDREVRGPLYRDFNTLIGDIDGKLRAIDPTLTSEALMPYMYQSKDVQQASMDWPAEVRHAVNDLRVERALATASLVDTVIAPRIRGQSIVSGLLDQPPYCRQGDGWYSHHTIQTCFLAAFRMVFAGVTGWRPNEGAVGEEVLAQHKSHLLHDREYLGMFNTEVFSEICDKRVLVRSFVGADLNMIEEFSARLKSRQPNAQIFCIVSLSSENGGGDKSIWHTNVLLGADENTVTVLDPAKNQTASPRRIHKEAFAARWATAFNRGHFIIAVPKP